MPVSRYATALLPLALLMASAAGPALAIVRRADVPDSRYLTTTASLPALADLASEGHGALIAPRWVVTAAHAVVYMIGKPDHAYVTIAGKRRAVKQIIPYPDYIAASTNWKAMFVDLKTTDVAAWKARYDTAMASMHDIALVELEQPVEDVAPLPIYRGTGEAGQTGDIYGAGAPGTSTSGSPDDAPHRGALRRAENRITSANGPWLRYVFDCGPAALPLEGVIGSGDSGGPMVIRDKGTLSLAGLSHGLDGSLDDIRQTKTGTFHQGLCGQTFASTRVSFYATWIDQTIASTR